MAIAHPASSEAGSQPESQKKPKSQTETHVDRGTELEAASPVAASPGVWDAISHGKRKRRGDLEAGAGGGRGGGGARGERGVAEGCGGRETGARCVRCE